MRGGGGSGLATVLGNFSAERPTNVDNSRARAYCASNRCGLGVSSFSLLSTI